MFRVLAESYLDSLKSRVYLQNRDRTGRFFFYLAQQPPVGHGLLIYEVSRSHTTTHHSRYDSSGRVISPTHKPLPDNTQHSQQTSMPPLGFEPTISAGERPQTYALDRAASGTGRTGTNGTPTYGLI